MPTAIKGSEFLDANSSGLITWSGEPIPCLKICRGDNLNHIVFTFAEKICELTNPLDLSDLTLQCALDIFNNDEPATRTIANVLQLLIDNDCGLKTLIDGLQNQIDGISEDNLVLNLGCLIEYYKDQFGNALPYTTKSILQNLINEICSLKTLVTNLSGQVTTMNTTLNNHITNHPVPVLPNVTNCISTNKVLNLALNDTAAAICDYKSHIGTVGQKNTAIARQTSDIEAMMSGVIGWIPQSQVTTAMQSMNNLWLLMEKYRTDIEANSECCDKGCDVVKIGFIIDIVGDTAILKFTLGAGTKIPVGYTDCGSTVTIKNQDGVTFGPIGLAITQNFESDAIDLTAFKKGDILNFNVSSSLCNGTYTCQKCTNKVFTYLSDDCCLITNNGTTDVTLIYSTVLTPSS